MRRSISTTSGPQLGGQSDRVLPGAGLADHVEVGLGVEHGPQALPYDRVVVHHQHPDHGSVTRTVVPAAGALRTSRVPPTSSTRRRMPASP